MKKNTLAFLLIVTIALVGGCSQHQQNPNVLLGKDSNLNNLRELTNLHNQHYTKIHEHMTKEQLKEVESLLGKPVKDQAITYYHLKKKRSKGLHGLYLALTNADIEVLVFLQGERIRRIKVMNQGSLVKNGLIDQMINYSLKDIKRGTTYKDYQDASPEIKTLINKLMVSMAFLKVKGVN